jgi:hypothetical protein
VPVAAAGDAVGAPAFVAQAAGHDYDAVPVTPWWPCTRCKGWRCPKPCNRHVRALWLQTMDQ